VNAADGWRAAEGAVWSALVVVVEPVWQRVPADADQVPRLRHAATAFAAAHCRPAGITAPSTAAGLGMGLEIMRRIANAHITTNGRGTRVELRFPRRSACT
jgi:hypothetical protein